MEFLSFLKWIPQVRAYIGEIYFSDAYPTAGRPKNKLTPVVFSLSAIIFVGVCWYIVEKVNQHEEASIEKYRYDNLNRQYSDQVEKNLALRTQCETLQTTRDNHLKRVRELELSVGLKERDIGELSMTVMQLTKDISNLTEKNAKQAEELRKQKPSSRTKNEVKKSTVGTSVYNELAKGVK